MHIFINDVATECPENSTILQVLTQQDISPLNIAIALDNKVVPKAQWEIIPFPRPETTPPVTKTYLTGMTVKPPFSLCMYFQSLKIKSNLKKFKISNEK